MRNTYVGRHRPPTRAERRAMERRTRAPKSFGPGYALPTAAAATLVISAAGATAAQSSAFGAVQPGAAQAALQAPAPASAQQAQQAATPQTSALARDQFAAQLADTSSLAERRKAASSSIAEDQGRAQERQRVARDKKRKALAAKKRKAAAAAKKRAAAPSSSSATSATSTKLPSKGSTAAGPQSWVQPLDSMVFTSPYGPRWGRLHAGHDYSAPIGTPLKSMSSGTIIFAGSMQGYGTTVDIKYWDGTVSRYGHMNAISVSVGQKVGPGDVVGQSGNTGRSTGPHLHLEIHPGGGSPIDPGPWLAAKGII